MTTLDKNIVQINGPVNIARLEGQINGLKKVVYLFMDHHIPVQFQTECDNIFARDVQTFLADSFKNIGETGLMYDFFIEERPENIINEDGRTTNLQKEGYIWEVVKMFNKIFKFDPKENKVLSSNVFENVRFHYADIREYIYLDTLVLYNDIRDLLQEMQKNNFLDPYVLDQIVNILNNIFEKNKPVIDIMNSLEKISEANSINKITPLKYPKVYEDTNIPLTNKTSDKDANTLEKQQNLRTDYFKYFLNKLYNSYKDKNIKSKLLLELKQLKNNITNLQNKITKTIDNIKKIIEEIEQSKNKVTLTDYSFFMGISPYDTRIYIANLFNHISMLATANIIENIGFMDVFFLRRFLDKDYITNAIIYSGSLHSANYMKILVKEFDFKVTHISKSQYPIDKLNDSIKEKNNLAEIVYLAGSNIQCSDITNFPKNFQ
ncbi:hypothetical protein QJ850_gp806 [Acanthamoeba polyphaga mimivirus]|uniref:Uncharacterized protein n=1 Tax=Acanthamoeba polyphaga mimivirus Kroon TaxID=3069720 RepID=A0A0G2Y2B5_9VIRU|nr:hypothetical protein QJ850_gp806 [Acanthamoeba polyphaga mimivirus]AKI79893.1 hypothetical protein [Acanthamoeba polyphaga mimivirus Kroon]